MVHPEPVASSPRFEARLPPLEAPLTLMDTSKQQSPLKRKEIAALVTARRDAPPCHRVRCNARGTWNDWLAPPLVVQIDVQRKPRRRAP